MATTQKGIYYPDDYTAVADVPEDMKDLAESVDAALDTLDTKVDKEEGKGLSTYNFGTVSKGRLDSLWQGKATVDSDIARIKATFPTTTGEGKNITLSKTAELDFIQPPLPRGNSEQVQYSGKNLYHNSLRTSESTIAGVTITPNADGTITLNGTATSSGYINLDNKNYNSNIGTLYEVSTTRKSVSNSDYTISCYITNGTLSAVAYDNNNKITFAQLKNGQTYSNAVLYLQIEQGTTATAYEPYCGGTASPNPSYPQPITNVTGDVEVLVQNKNLFDKNTQVNNKGLTWSDGNLYNADRRMVSDYISINNISSVYSNYYFYIFFYDINKIYLGNSSNLRKITGEAYTNIAIPSNENIKYFRLVFAPTINNDKDMTTVEDVMVTKTQAGLTTYTPHKEQTYTFPLGTQRMYLGDYLADDGIHHVRKQVVLDGTENWTYGSNNFSITGTNYKTYSNGGRCYSSHFIGSAIDDVINTDLHMWIGNATFIVCRYSSITSANDFKTWLGTHNVTVEYELATEEITPYTEPQQAVYDEIKQAISYEEQTNISGSSDESNPLFSVEAYQSTKLILQEISNAVVALGGV